MQHPLTGLPPLDHNLYNPPDVSCWCQDAVLCNTKPLSHQGAAQPPNGCNGLVLITWRKSGVANDHMATDRELIEPLSVWESGIGYILK